MYYRYVIVFDMYVLFWYLYSIYFIFEYIYLIKINERFFILFIFFDWKEYFILKFLKLKLMFENVIDLVYDWLIGVDLFNLFYFYFYINVKRLFVNICVIVLINGVY